MRNMLAIAALGLILTGCAATPAAVPDANTPAEEPTPTISAAPLAEQPDSGAEKLAVEAADEPAFIRAAAASWKGTMPSEGDLLGAGYFACDELRAGKAEADIVAVQGDSEDAIYNNGVVAAYATLLCPDLAND